MVTKEETWCAGALQPEGLCLEMLVAVGLDGDVDQSLVKAVYLHALRVAPCGNGTLVSLRTLEVGENVDE